MFELGSSDGESVAVVPAQLSEMGAAVNAALRVDVAALDDDRLRSFVVGVERLRARMDGLSAIAIAELDERGHTDEWDGMRTGQWIAREARTPVGPAKRRVTVARRLRNEFPQLLKAVEDGLISWFHADAFCHAANERIAELMAMLIPELVDLARGMRFDPWRRELHRAAARLDVDGADQSVGSDDKLFLSRRLDGVREIAGRFAGVDGAALEEMLEAETDHQYRLAQELAKQTDGETDIPTRAELRAAALMELLRRTTGANPGGATAVELTIARHTHDDCCTPPDDPTAAIRRATDQLFESTFGDVFAFWQLETHLCDPIILIAELEHAGIDGEELNLRLGREQRLGNRAQRRAACARDGGCVFPGCNAHVRWTDLHHVNWWRRGGLTDINNLACLCRFHHGVTHRKGWTMTAHGDGTFTWTTPTGRTLHSQQHGVIRAGPARAGP